MARAGVGEDPGVREASITSGLVSELVATQFPQWVHLSVAAVDFGGHDNLTFRLGDDLSVRLPSADAYSPQVGKEQRWLPILAPHLPVPIPAEARVLCWMQTRGGRSPCWRTS
jgi:aminoglycoside phosphotransferase (APT) family kinase protein